MIKKMKLPVMLLFVLMAMQAFAAKGPSYKISVKINGLKDTLVYLAFYMGENTYLADSVRMDKKGVAVFARDTALECGVYMVAVGQVKLFEFVVSENEFSLETDTADYLMHMKVKNSKQNEVFFEFNQYVHLKGLEEEGMRELVQKWSGDPAKRDTVAKLNARIKDFPKEIYTYRTGFMEKNPDAIITQIFNLLKEPNVPPAPAGADSNWQYYYYRDHYWDNVDFTSGCVLRSPLYHSKLMRFMENGYQHPDSLYQNAVRIIEKTRVNKEMFRYTLVQLVTKYAKSNYVCMDGVRYRLEAKYYTYEDCFWLDSTEIYRTRANAEENLPTLCYLPAPRLAMYDSTLQRKINKAIEADTNEATRPYTLGALLAKEKTTDLYNIKAKYTVVVFWDPDCGHCKKEMPLIKALYDSVKSKGVEVYAVGVEKDLEKWVQYIRDNKLNWINVTDVWNMTHFRKFYNINSTPQVYLLDSEKNILAKRLGAEQLKEILYTELHIPYTAPPKKDGEADDHNEH